MPTSFSETILGSRRRPSRRTVARQPEPESESTPTPRPVRRVTSAQAAPPAPPPERKKANAIRALIVDPVARTIEEVRIETEPGDADRGYGAQIAMGAVEEIVGSDSIEWIELGDGNEALVDRLRQGETAEAWRYGDSDS